MKPSSRLVEIKKFLTFKILNSYFKKNKKEGVATLALILISIIFLYTRTHNLPSRFTFDYDQEVASDASYSIIHDKKLTLIGQETSTGGLFVGPYLYYIESIAMLIGRFNPLSLGYLGVLFSCFNLIAIFLVTRDLFGKGPAILASYLYTISATLYSYDTYGNAIPYMMFVSILIFWFSYKLFVHKRQDYLIPLTLAIGMSLHVHVAILLLIPAVLFVCFISKSKLKVSQSFLVLLILSFFLAPLLLFETRHNFLLTNHLFQFTKQSSSFSALRSLRTLNTLATVSSESIFTKVKYPFIIFSFLILTFIYLQKKKENLKKLIVLMAFVFFPLILLLIYRGPSPEYYFLPTIPIILIMAGVVYYRGIKLFGPIALIVLAMNTYINVSSLFNSNHHNGSFRYKNEIVSWIVADSGNESFNVYYEIPQALNNGYRFLFKWKKKEPVDLSQNLYIIDYSNNQGLIEKYQSTFSSKNVALRDFGNIHVISVRQK